jgi:hypothetical protein
MILGVTASRTWKDRRQIADAFQDVTRFAAMIGGPIVVINGGARGGDELCHVEADSRGWHTATMKALWDFYGKPAGHVRDAAMIYLGMHADRWLAFLDQCKRDECQGKIPHDTHGAGKTAERAEAAGIEVRRYGWRY